MFEYINALLGHWVAFVTGIGSLLLGSYLRLTGKPKTPAYAVAGLGLVALFIAGYQTWSDEHSRAARLDSELIAMSQPKMDVLFDQINVSANMKDHEGASGPAVIAWLSIHNMGAPSIAVHYRLKVTFPNTGTVVWGSPVQVADGVIRQEGEPNIDVSKTQLADKTAEDPIPHNGARSGIVIFRLPAINDEGYYQKSGVTYSVMFEDINNKVWSCDRVLTGVASRMQYFPGGPPVIP